MQFNQTRGAVLRMFRQYDVTKPQITTNPGQSRPRKKNVCNQTHHLNSNREEIQLRVSGLGLIQTGDGGTETCPIPNSEKKIQNKQKGDQMDPKLVALPFRSAA